MVQETVSSEQDWLLEMGSRIRTVEGQYNMLRDRVLIVNNNMIGQYKKNMVEFKTVNEDMREMKEEMFKLKEIIRHLLKEIEMFARKENVHVLEKYINLWNPMNFVTEKEVKKLIEEHGRRKE